KLFKSPPDRARAGPGRGAVRLAKRGGTACELEVRSETGARGVTVDGSFLSCDVGRILVPRVRVLPVVQILGELRELQRMEGVAHHGKLRRLVHPNRFLRQTRLRTVRQTRRMQGNRPDLHPAP